MTAEELKKAGAIYLDNVEEGLRNYENRTVVMEQEEAFRILREMAEALRWKQVYADFYYYTFSREIRAKLDEFLTEEECEYLREKEVPQGQIFFPLDEKMLSILTKWNAKEALFSTVYFTGMPGARATWWGNYGKQYLIFTDVD